MEKFTLKTESGVLPVRHRKF